MLEHEGHLVEGRVSMGTASSKASVSQSVKWGKPPPRPCTGAGHGMTWVRLPIGDTAVPQVDGGLHAVGRAAALTAERRVQPLVYNRGPPGGRGCAGPCLSYHC